MVIQPIARPDRHIDLRRLLRPNAIAVAGASPDPASLGGAVLRNIQASGFSGDLHLVSPTRKDINGTPCLPSLRDLPLGVDVAVLNLPRAAIREALSACVERRVGGAIVFAAGFSEASEDGRREQEEIAALCREGGLALLGPNCLGLTHYGQGGVALTFDALDFKPIQGARRVAVIAQSGATAANIRSALAGRGVPVSHVITTGNEAVLRADHFIQQFVEDGVAAIAVYVEQIRNPAAFLEAARSARKAGIPIVMVHPGSSARGREAAQSHTGALVGEYAVMKAFVEREAVMLVETLDELFDTTAILYRFPEPPAGDAAIITNSGAIRGMSLDFCEQIGLKLARLSEADKAQLQTLVPPQFVAENPFDIGTAGYSDNTVFAASTLAMLANPAVGSVLLALTGGGPAQQRAKGDAIIPVALKAGKPVVVAITGDDSPLDSGLTEPMQKSETPFFRSPERALRALAAVHRYAGALRHAAEGASLPETPPLLLVPGVTPEYRGKELLRAIGVRVPEGALVRNDCEAAGVAHHIGYPVVIKAQAAALAHKSDAGGVIVGIEDEPSLRAKWADLVNAVSHASPDTVLDGILVEKMSKPGLELVVGGRNDPQWGPVIVFGLGGVWIEALDALETLPANTGRGAILDRLRHMRGAKLLGAFRGQKPRDLEAVADILMRLGGLLCTHRDLKDVEINPLAVFAEGEGAMALDAMFVVDDHHKEDKK